MIDFAFTDEQRSFAEAARALFDKESPASRLRAVWAGTDDGAQLWPAIERLGLLSLAAPEELGGMGGDEIDLALVLEEVGRAALPEPLAEVLVAIRALALNGSLRPEHVDGSALCIATDEPAVPDADRASVVIVGERAYRSFETLRIPSVDHGRRLFTVRATDEGEPVACAERSTWARACILNGLSARLLEDAVAYATDRKQFGVAIGSFQAVKHHLASVHVHLTSARAAAHGAAYALATATDVGHAVSAAIVEAATAHAAANRVALQVHGGIGFTFEHDLHLWLKRGLALSFGARDHARRLGAHLVGEDH